MATNRRSFLIAGGAAVATALAGCTGDDSGPEGTVEEFYSRLDDGDIEGARELYHPDADEDLDGADADELDQLDIDVTDTAIVGREDEDDEAVVEATLTVTGEIDGEEVDFEEPFESLLRQSDGEWLLVEEDPQRQEEQPAPQVSLDIDCDDGAVVVLHQAGDELLGDDITDQGDGSFDADLSVGNTVTLVESPSGETSHTLVHEPSESVIFDRTADCS